MSGTGKILVHVVGNSEHWYDGQELYRTDDEWDAITFARKWNEEHGNELHEVWGGLNIVNEETGITSENW